MLQYSKVDQKTKKLIKIWARSCLKFRKNYLKFGKIGSNATKIV